MDASDPDMMSSTGSGRSPLTRRRLIGGAAALGIGAGGGAWIWRARSGAEGSEGNKRTLRMLCWPGYDDPEVTRAFREKHGVAIEATHIGANDEIFTLLRAGGLGEYDVVTPHNGIVKPLAEAGLIEPLDPDLLPNGEGLFPRFRWPSWVTAERDVYGAPFLWGTSPMVYAAGHVAKAPTAWLDIQSAKFKGRIVMTEDGLGHFLIWNAVMGHDDPTRVTISDLNATTDLLISIKRDRASAYVGSMNDVARLLADGTAWVSTIGWESAPHLPGAKGADLRITHPRPGDYSFCDNLSLAKNSPNPDLAHAFIDHMLAPETQARLMNKLMRGTVTTKAVDLLDPKVRALYSYDDLDAVFALSPLRGFPPLQDAGDGIATYVDWVKSWERVRFTALRPPPKK
ncbi:MAG: spermidine/putrescine transport system substrate-binding protein [Thermomicrobiales bacterium]|nr:spermidine/putrescine transport system substrate-binding protein [Thermomicrobiales bacterium]